MRNDQHNAIETDTFRYAGRKWAMALYADDSGREPWNEADGHGSVTEWTQRDAEPGERLLVADGYHKRFYAWDEAISTAIRDAWGWLPGPLVIERDPVPFWSSRKPGRATCEAAGLSYHDSRNFNRATSRVYDAHRKSMNRRDYAVEAVRRDYNFLRSWCLGEWFWVVLEVTPYAKNGIDLLDSRSDYLGLLGYEPGDMDSMANIRREAEGMADEIVFALRPGWVNALARLQWRIPNLVRRLAKPFAA